MQMQNNGYPYKLSQFLATMLQGVFLEIVDSRNCVLYLSNWRKFLFLFKIIRMWNSDITITATIKLFGVLLFQNHLIGGINYQWSTTYKATIIFKTTQDLERNEIYLYFIANYKNDFEIKSKLLYCQLQIINFAA